MWFDDAGHHHAALMPDRIWWVSPGEAAMPIESLPQGPGEPPWQGAVTAFGERLRALGSRKASLDLRLGAALVRWQRLDWPVHVGSPDELDAAVRLSLRNVHGNAVAGWQVMHNGDAPGEPLLVAAVDADLSLRLRAELARVGWRLRSMQPYAASALNHWRQQWRRGSAWVAVIEPDHLTLALVHDGHWLGLSSVACTDRGPGGWAGSLPALQARMLLQCEAPIPADTPSFALGPASLANPLPAGWRFLVPEGIGRTDFDFDRLARGC